MTEDLRELKKSTDLGTLLLAVLLVLCVVSITVVVGLNACSPRQSEVTLWHHHEIIGQGRLVSIDCIDGRDSGSWLISLELMSAASMSERIIMETTVYHVSGELKVSDTEGNYLDSKVFKIGVYYVLYRKVDIGTIYCLFERSDLSVICD